MGTENTSTVETATPPTEAPAVAAQPAPQVERSLADHIADHARYVNERAGRPAQAAEPAKEDATQAATAPPAQAVAATEPAKEEPAKEPEPKPEDKPTEQQSRAKDLADFVKLQRQNRAETQRLKSEREAFQAEQTAAKAALEAEKASTTASKAEIAKFEKEFSTDPVTAVMRRLGSEKFRTDFLLSALDRAGKDEDVPEIVMSNEEREKLIEESASAKALEKLREETKAEESKKATEAQQRNAAAQVTYFQRMDDFLAKNATKFPNMVEDGWPTEGPTGMIAAIEQHKSATGQWPTHEMVLAHFEAKHVAEAEKYARRNGFARSTEAPKPTPGMAPVKTPLDVRGKASTTPDPRSPSEKKAEILARLDGQRVGA